MLIPTAHLRIKVRKSTPHGWCWIEQLWTPYAHIGESVERIEFLGGEWRELPKVEIETPTVTKKPIYKRFLPW